MSTKITEENIRAMPPHKRHDLYKGALRERTKGNPDAERIIDMLERLGLPFSDDVALREGEPIADKIAEIAFSKEGTAAMERAIADGLPPLAGLDPLLAQALGKDFGAHNRSTNWAGRIAAERMRQKGYRKIGKMAALPKHCVARSAELFE